MFPLPLRSCVVKKQRQGTEYRMRSVGTLVPPAGFDSLVTAQMGPDGPVTIWCRSRDDEAAAPPPEQDRQRPGWPSVRAGREVALASYTAASLLPSGVVHLDLPVAFPFVQPLPDGGYLVVGARSAMTPDGPEPNAVAVSAAGEVLHRGAVGDGIEHLQADRSGRIWAGYSDDGIFGGDPLAAPGLVRWSAALEREWAFPGGTDAHIADVYVMNVSDGGVVTCPYMDFPVIRVRDDVVSVHPTDAVTGPRGIVVSGDTVGLIGSSKDHSSLLVGRLGPTTFTRARRGYLTLPDGSPVPQGLAFECRGPSANLFHGTEWCRFRLDDLNGGF